MNDDRTGAVAAEILAYLESHPGAADTADGVHRWWLVDGGGYALAEVERALDRLARQGQLDRRRLPDGRLLYASLP